MATALELEISDFFDHQYNAAFSKFDGDRIASLYHAPTITMRGDGSIQSHDELTRFFQGVANWTPSAAYSMISSASPSNIGGIVSPSSFAVLRLMIISNLVGRITGKSEGFSPRKMRPT
jgi:hypothetical protein